MDFFKLETKPAIDGRLHPKVTAPSPFGNIDKIKICRRSSCFCQALRRLEPVLKVIE